MHRVFTARGIAFAVLLVAGALYVLISSLPQPQVQPMTTTTVTTGSTTLAVEVADTPQERVQGLSGRSAVPQGGLLFDFLIPGDYGIWMKDMNFSIDIIWANEGRVVTVLHDVSPATYPEVFHAAGPARYVLELPAGAARTYGVAEGGEFVVQ